MMNKTDLVIRDMFQPGKASFLVGGQWGSEGKGCAAAWLAYEMAKRGLSYDIVTTNAGAQAGHTSTHKGKTRVVFHLPTIPLIASDEGQWRGKVFLNAGSIIDPKGLLAELETFKGDVIIHPRAAVITDECKEAELKADSSRTKIASTRKGVGEALSRKVQRSAILAKDHPDLKGLAISDLGLNLLLSAGMKVAVEVPQGVSLSLNHSSFYPYCTSRDCIPSSAMADAGIHPYFYGSTMVVLRTFPIRVGNIVEEGKTLGQSGGHYQDQKEVSWKDLGVEAEITTVTKRVRRVFTFSKQQIVDTFNLCRPDVVFLTFCNYLKGKVDLEQIESDILAASRMTWMPPPRILFQWGPTTEDVKEDI